MGAGQLAAHYIFKPGDDNIYFAVEPTNTTTHVTELRFIFRLDREVFPHGINKACDVVDGVALEGADVFDVAGYSRSKFYSSIPLKFNGIFGIASRDGEGVYFSLDQAATETMSGGPFDRDITSQSTNVAQQLSAYLFSLHSQSEAFRPGLKIFAAVFGQRPQEHPDLSFIADLDIPGYVSKDERGSVRGVVHGMKPLRPDCSRSRDWYDKMMHHDRVSVAEAGSQHRPGHITNQSTSASQNEYTIVLNNEAAQYWSDVDEHGNFAVEGLLPGSYILTLYQDQLDIASTTVEVKARNTSHASVSTPGEPNIIWNIGCFDGRPHGFKNADKIERMHPSDPRMLKWKATIFKVGSSTDQFPMAQIRHFNPTTIVFELSSEQAAESRTLIIAITADFDSGRPLLTVNGIVLKPSKTPAHATFYGTPVYASRSFTRGAYRKVPTTYAFSSLRLKEGRNEIVIDVADGTTSDQRSPFLQPSFIYDFVALM